MKLLKIATIIPILAACSFAQIVDVPGDGRFTGNLTVMNGVIWSTGSSGGSITVFNPNNQGASVSLNWLNNIARIRIGGSGAGANNGFQIQKPGDIALLTVTDNGSVGIGTSSPASGYMLDVYDCVRLGVAGNHGSQAYSMGFTRCNGLLNFPGIYSSGTNPLVIAGKVDGTGKVAFSDSVGIGTTSPSEKLEVAGNIRCNAVKINTWSLEAPDYVFEKDYKLPTLKEVGRHITEKKHLIGVPSAKEMKKNGLDVAEMNMLLLKKVEELTLYAIEQNKRIEALEKRETERK